LDRVVARQGRAAAVALLESHFAQLAARLDPELSGRGPAERLHLLGRVLSDEGYMAEVTADASEGTLTERNCAIPAVAQRFPELCAAEARFLAAVVGGEVERRQHILSGCGACQYHVRFNTARETS
ncbi:MAG: hypothetical protein ABJC36_04790, partial [Gemmatimonadales bacterium]